MPKKSPAGRAKIDAPVTVADREAQRPIQAGGLDALINAEMVNVFQATFSNPKVAPEGASKGSSPVSVRHRIFVRAWVRNVAYGKKVWIDASLLDHAGKIVGSENMLLRYIEPAGGGGDFFQTDTVLPAASPGQLSGGVRKLQFRLYYKVNGELFSDGNLHERSLLEV